MLKLAQRQTENPNQSYLTVYVRMCHANIFPDRGIHFTVLIDYKRMIFSRAHTSGKTLNTPHNNSLIGEYFRNRLGLPSGEMVTKDDLERYGRTNIAFYKIDNETYYMDFSTQ